MQGARGRSSRPEVRAEVLARQLTCAASSSQGLAAGVLNIHPEVRDALAVGRPVVALESTIISHGEKPLPPCVCAAAARAAQCQTLRSSCTPVPS